MNCLRELVLCSLKLYKYKMRDSTVFMNNHIIIKNPFSTNLKINLLILVYIFSEYHL